MAQEFESDNVESVDDRPRDRRRGPLPLVMLVLLTLIILWLVWQFFGKLPVSSGVTETTSTSTVDLSTPVVPEPEIPAQAVGATETEEVESLVPDVVGDAKESATVTLENAGYAVTEAEVYSDSAPAGIVVEQNPSGGTVLQPGAVVGITVSRGTGEVTMVTMPDVIGLTQSAAEAKVRAAGLKPYLLHGTDIRYAGRIGSQWPKPGSELPEGGEGFIQLMVSR